MKIEVRNDNVLIEGYVNAIERFSKPLFSPIGKFLEKVCKGAFNKAIKRNDDVKILFNHNWDRVLGGTKEGNLELYEDNIGLRAKAKITDAEIINKAKKGDLIGWSFGFSDIDGAVLSGEQEGIPTRSLIDLNLYEVSILDRTRTPAYEGTLIEARNDGTIIQHRELETMDNVEITEEPLIEPPKVDYTELEIAIKIMKGN